MAIVLQRAVKLLKPMKVLMYGPTYAGKTMSSLLLAVGMVMQKRGCTEEEAYKHVLLYDTEYKRGTLYSHLGAYNYLSMDPPYTTEALIDAVNELGAMDEVDVIIIDSFTHFWSKDGGILDQKAAKDRQGGNSYTNWQDFTAKFNKCLDVLLQSPKSIIVTSRAKTDTALVANDKGKQMPVTYGLKPELRDNIEYEFDIVFNIDKSTHSLIVDKGVPGMALSYDIATPALGSQLYDLVSANAVVQERQAVEVIKSIRDTAKQHNLITFVQLMLSGKKLDDLSLQELNTVEGALIAEIKKLQPKK